VPTKIPAADPAFIWAKNANCPPALMAGVERKA
jgi:hypothetical protein